MNKQIASAALACFTALFLAACATGPAPQAAAKPAAPALTAEAKSALAQAEADIKAAKAEYGLWTTAQDALKDAQEAAKKGDSTTVLREAKEASALAKLGLAQNKYPSTELK